MPSFKVTSVIPLELAKEFTAQADVLIETFGVLSQGEGGNMVLSFNELKTLLKGVRDAVEIAALSDSFQPLSRASNVLTIVLTTDQGNEVYLSAQFNSSLNLPLARKAAIDDLLNAILKQLLAWVTSARRGGGHE